MNHNKLSAGASLFAAHKQQIGARVTNRNNNKLHVFQVGPDTVIAVDTDDAWAVWCAHPSESRVDYDTGPDTMQQLPDDQVIVVLVDDLGNISDVGKAVGKTAARWTEIEGRGFLCSTEY